MLLMRRIREYSIILTTPMSITAIGLAKDANFLSESGEKKGWHGVC